MNVDFVIAILNVWRVTIQAAFEAFLLIPCHILDGDTGWERKGKWTERMPPLLYPTLLQCLAEEGRLPVLMKSFHRAVEDGAGSGGCHRSSWDAAAGRRGGSGLLIFSAQNPQEE